MEQPRIQAVNATGDGHTLSVTWMNDKSDVIDVAPIIDELAVFAPLAEPDSFAKVAVGDFGWSIEWPDAAPDASLSADALYRLAREQAGDVMRRQEFREWRRRNSLSLSKAAEALGISRRIVSYYESGERLIPKTIRLASMGWEMQSRSQNQLWASVMHPGMNSDVNDPVAGGGYFEKPHKK